MQMEMILKMEQVQTINQTNVFDINMINIKLSGMLAEVIVRSASTKIHNRSGGRKSTALKLHTDVTDEEAQHAEDIRSHSIGNTLRKFKRLLYANFSHGFTFLTLTFDKEKCDFDTSDVATCRTKFTNFWKNLKRGTKPSECISEDVSMVYLGVIEFHQDGSVHFHILCHVSSEYCELLKKKWHHGYLDFQRSNEDPLSVQKIESYMRKGIHDPRLNQENHRYLASRNLKQPVIFKFTNNGLPTWINDNNSELKFKDNSEHGFTYYQFITRLTEDEFQSYIESSDANQLHYLIEQMEMIQQQLADVA